MFGERWKHLWGGKKEGSKAPTAPASGLQSPSPDSFINKSSNGLDQFFQSLSDREGLSILDLAGASQANILFITGLGHRIYSEDVIESLEASFPDGDQSNQDGVANFLEQSFNFRDYDFDGALLWDSLQFLEPPLLQLVIDRLHRTMRPDAYLFALFNPDEKQDTLPVHQYRIVNTKTVKLSVRGHRKPGQRLNNRTIERLFQRFSQVKFFLTRDNLREVIIRR